MCFPWYPVAPTAAAAPRFVVSAAADPGSVEEPSGLLQRIQLVKGWVGDDGLLHQRIVDVAGNGANGADVDLGSCEPRGTGAASLCGSWQDPDFDPTRPAVYYARVLENPSCRWHWRDCLSLPEGERPSACSDPTLPRTIQERAWTSPIWFSPAGE